MPLEFSVWRRCQYSLRMLKKARLLTHPTLARQDAPCPKQGRSERRGEEVPPALCVAVRRYNGSWRADKPLQYSDIENLNWYVEPLSDARTPDGNRRVSARWGWAGKKSDFFSILLEDAVVQQRTCSCVLVALEHRCRVSGHFVHTHRHAGQEEIALDII